MIEKNKDYFTEKEAAEYCNVSISQFRKIYLKYGSTRHYFMGKYQYSKSELKKAFESSRIGDNAVNTES